MKRQSMGDLILKVIMVGIITLFTAACIVPFILILSGSFTDEALLSKGGLSLIPNDVSLTAYQFLFSDFSKIVSAYKVTLIVTVIGTIFSLMLNALLAYPLSQRKLPGRNGLAFYVYFTMLFNGGMVPWYIISVNTLGLHNNYAALIRPYLGNAWNMFILRNYFGSIPEEMHESATIDGAGEFRIFWTIYMPLAIPALATISLFTALLYWNDWWLGIMLIENENLQPLQLILRAIISNIQFITAHASLSPQLANIKPPELGVRFAATIVTIGPIIIVYPLLQRFFVKGLLIGAVKG